MILFITKPDKHVVAVRTQSGSHKDVRTLNLIAMTVDRRAKTPLIRLFRCGFSLEVPFGTEPSPLIKLVLYT